ncbi:MAG: Eco57I restriction-modification methylase domain-containing protein [Isosphaerales bacterium]
MPVEAKPIFRPDVIRLPILGFSLPEQVAQRRAKLEKWAEIISTGSVDAHKEQEILADFINDVFCELLGYTRAVDNPSRYTISREKHVQANGKFADAVLGEFGPDAKRYVAAIEGKGPKDPLDRPFAGRKVSAVDQAFDYAINLRCNWILVTNIRQTRLYYKGTDKQTFERFDTEVLAQNETHLRKFVFLLHASRMVPLHGASHLDSLFQESEKVGSELTLEFYAHYAFARRSALSRLRWTNPDVEPRLILGCSQKLLDRILFIAFCEDRGLLPAETIKRAFSYRDPYNPRPLWDNFRGMFRAVFDPERGAGGFDVVIGNPPYIRQEWLSPIKPYLQSRYAAYHGMADLYVYFYELGLSLLRPGGRLSYVVTNKWMKAGYGEPLRKLFAEKGWVESVVDFGHAKQIFKDADVFPCIIVVRRPEDAVLPKTTRVCSIPREQLRIDDLSVQIAREGVEVERKRLNERGWSLDSESANSLLEKIRNRGVPLSEYLGVKPLMGIKTGLNEAFLIDTVRRNRIIEADPASQDVIRPYLRGQDIRRWFPDWSDLWMIALKSSSDHPWPWAQAGDGAEAVFRKCYPGLHAHLKPSEDALRKRQDQGRFWWELRACAYWDELSKPRITYQDITWTANFCLTPTEHLSNNTTYFIPSKDEWLLSVLNAPIGWWFAWRTAQHGKDEALRYFTSFMEGYPVPHSSNENVEQCRKQVRRLVEIVRSHQDSTRQILDWLKVEHSIEEPSLKIQSALEVDCESFVADVRKARGKKNPLSLSALRSLREEHSRTILPAQALAGEALVLERRISDLVNEAYGLTPDEIELMWMTGPPRMPISRN